MTRSWEKTYLGQVDEAISASIRHLSPNSRHEWPISLNYWRGLLLLSTKLRTFPFDFLMIQHSGAFGTNYGLSCSLALMAQTDEHRAQYIHTHSALIISEWSSLMEWERGVITFYDAPTQSHRTSWIMQCAKFFSKLSSKCPRVYIWPPMVAERMKCSRFPPSR